MKPIKLLLLIAFILGCTSTFGQKTNVLEQRVSIYAEEEKLSNVIEQICDYLNLNYSYNSKLLEGKEVSLSVSNIPLKDVFQKLMKDHQLIFEIEDNILVVRNYTQIQKTRYHDEFGNFIMPNAGFKITQGRKKSLTMDFKSASNLIIIPVKVNGSDTLNFILDTGVRSPIITELPYVNRLNLNHLRPIELRGLGDNVSISAYLSAGNRIELENLVAQNQDLQLVISEDFQVSKILGIPVHGLIGFDIFRDFVVKINYPARKITFTQKDHYKFKRRKRDIILPLTIEGYKPYITTTIVQDSLKPVRVKLLVDTGASDALWLATSTKEDLKLPTKHIDSFLGKGLTGDLFGKKARITGINIGSQVLFDPIVSYPDTSVVDLTKIRNNRNGTLGAEVLRRFVVTIDYASKRLILHPTRAIKERFTYNMSGLEVYSPMPGFPIFTINQVRKTSEAYAAGIRENDQILFINHNSHKNISLNEINMILQERENKKIKMIVLRDGKEIETMFKLKKEL